MAHDFIDSKKLTARINEVKEELAHLLHLESFLGKSPKGKLGRKPGRPAKASTVKKTKGKRAPKGQLGKDIIKFLEGKGTAGAHVKDIASHLKTKTANVTAWFYTTGKKAAKKVKPATFALVAK